MGVRTAGCGPRAVPELPRSARPRRRVRLIPTRLISADQLGLSRDIQALCSERDGLILVAGPRLSGKSTLISALVDLINRTRADYLITLESEIKFLHENRKAIVSQREVRSEPEVMLTSARAALRENPDVLVIDDLRTPELIGLALDAADSGHLVIGSVTAHTTSAAIARLIDTTPFERQTQVALALSETLRGAVAQVLLRKSGGGRVAARELLFNTPSVASLIAEGKISQLPVAIDSGRKYGMVPMNDALIAFVQSGAVDAREAYRKAFDRGAFLEQLRREASTPRLWNASPDPCYRSIRSAIAVSRKSITCSSVIASTGMPSATGRSSLRTRLPRSRLTSATTRGDALTCPGAGR